MSVCVWLGGGRRCQPGRQGGIHRPISVAHVGATTACCGGNARKIVRGPTPMALRAGAAAACQWRALVRSILCSLGKGQQRVAGRRRRTSAQLMH